MMVCCQGIRAPQRPTGSTLGSTVLNMRAGRVGGSASQRPQHLTGTTKGPTGGQPCDNYCDLWNIRPGTAFHAKMKVQIGGKLGVEDVEIGGNLSQEKGNTY